MDKERDKEQKIPTMPNVNVVRNKKARDDLSMDKENQILDHSEHEGIMQNKDQTWHMKNIQDTQASSYTHAK